MLKRVARIEQELEAYRSVDVELFYSATGQSSSRLDICVTNHSALTLYHFNAYRTHEAFFVKIVDPSSENSVFSAGSPGDRGDASSPDVEFKPGERLDYVVPVPQLQSNAEFRISLTVSLQSYNQIVLITELGLRTDEKGCIVDIYVTPETTIRYPAVEGRESQLRGLTALHGSVPQEKKIDIQKLLLEDQGLAAPRAFKPLRISSRRPQSPLSATAPEPHRMETAALKSAKVVPSGNLTMLVFVFLVPPIGVISCHWWKRRRRTGRAI